MNTARIALGHDRAPFFFLRAVLSVFAAFAATPLSASQRVVQMFDRQRAPAGVAEGRSADVSGVNLPGPCHPCPPLHGGHLCLGHGRSGALTAYSLMRSITRSSGSRVGIGVAAYFLVEKCGVDEWTT